MLRKKGKGKWFTGFGLHAKHEVTGEAEDCRCK